jgi:putative transposase
MIDRSHDLPVVRQCQILSLARSSAYYRPQEASEADLALMRRIDELHLAHPFAGSRMLRDLLRQDGHQIGRKHVTTLMKRMGIEALYKKPNTSKRHPAHAVYPYLLRNIEINRPNHVFAADITYIPMKRGFVYLFAVMDWASRRVLSWRLSNTLTTDFCLEAVEEAIHCYGKPEIFNTDQGSQFTSMEFTQLLKDHDIAISMDGKGCWRDNVFVERLGKSIKYEEV